MSKTWIKFKISISRKKRLKKLARNKDLEGKLFSSVATNLDKLALKKNLRSKIIKNNKDKLKLEDLYL